MFYVIGTSTNRRPLGVNTNDPRFRRAMSIVSVRLAKLSDVEYRATLNGGTEEEQAELQRALSAAAVVDKIRLVGRGSAGYFRLQSKLIRELGLEASAGLDAVTVLTMWVAEELAKRLPPQ